jgi:GNAT superfamily N-acetyltransferase
MNITETLKLSAIQKEAVYNLWNNEYPAKLSYSNCAEFDEYLAGLHNHNHLLLTDNNEVVGWYFQFEREKELWFAMILNRKLQRKGWGTQLINRAKKSVDKLNGWVIDHPSDIRQDGSPYPSPKRFYIKNNFTIVDDVRLELEKISAVKIIWERDDQSGGRNLH